MLLFLFLPIPIFAIQTYVHFDCDLFDFSWIMDIEYSTLQKILFFQFQYSI